MDYSYYLSLSSYHDMFYNYMCGIDDLPVSLMYNMLSKLLMAPIRKIVFPTLTVGIIPLLTRRYTCPVPPI
jgi:hypothetical protein